MRGSQNNISSKFQIQLNHKSLQEKQCYKAVLEETVTGLNEKLVWNKQAWEAKNLFIGFPKIDPRVSYLPCSFRPNNDQASLRIPYWLNLQAIQIQYC